MGKLSCGLEVPTYRTICKEDNQDSGEHIAKDYATRFHIVSLWVPKVPSHSLG